MTKRNKLVALVVIAVVAVGLLGFTSAGQGVLKSLNLATAFFDTAD